jgi:hypothetical protein
MAVRKEDCMGIPTLTTTEQQGTTVISGVRIENSFGSFGTQRLERTFSGPRAVGEGARRAVRPHGDALEQLAE